jgi:ABC-type transport system involved in multi-copper enzyme maturation permease subunit
MKTIRTVAGYELRLLLPSLRFISLAFLLCALVYAVNSSGFLQILIASLAGMRGQVSLTIVIPYYLLIWFIPTVAIVLSSDAIAGGVADGTLRLIATKVSRAKILFGKYLAALITLILLIFLAFAVNLLYTLSMTGAFLGIDAVPYMIYLSLLAAAWLAVVFLFSSALSTPQQALNASLIGVVLLETFYYSKWSLDSYSICGLRGSMPSCSLYVFIWLAAALLLAVLIFRRRSL